MVVVAALGACSGARDGERSGWVELSATGSEQTMPIAGVVRYIDVEGGVYVIRDLSGDRFQPRNLPGQFQRDGLAVEAEVRRRDDMVSIGMAGVQVDLVRIRERAPGTTAGSGLTGTSWRLENLAGFGVVDGVPATLSFPEDGMAQGNGSCNRFHGHVETHGDAILFGPLAATKKLCTEAIMTQEDRYLEALRGATRFEIREPFLTIWSVGAADPLRFVRED